MIRKQLSIFQVETLVGRDWRRSRYSPPKQKFLNPNFSMCSPISKNKSLRIHISLHVLMYKSFSICIFSPISTYCILAGWRCTTNESLQWGWAKDFIFDTLLKTLFLNPSLSRWASLKNGSQSAHSEDTQHLGSLKVNEEARQEKNACLSTIKIELKPTFTKTWFLPNAGFHSCHIVVNR